MRHDQHEHTNAIELFDSDIKQGCSQSGIHSQIGTHLEDELLDDINIGSPSTKKELELALWGSGQSVWMWSKTNDTIDLKFYVENRFEFNEISVPFNSLTVNIHPDDAESFLDTWKSHCKGQTSELLIKFRYLKNKEYLWYVLRGKVTSTDDNGATAIVGTFADITDAISKQTKLSLMSQAFSKSKQAMLVLSQSMLISEYNDAWIEQFDPFEVSLNGLSLAELVPITKHDMLALESKGFIEKSTTLSIPEQDECPIELLINQFESKDTQSKYYIVVAKDLSDSIATKQELHRLATRDQVTGLINRFELQNQLDHLISTKIKFEVFYIDLNGEKEVSDALGHENRDRLLQNVATGLIEELNDALHISTWGSSEFIIVYKAVNHAERQRLVTLIQKTISNNTFINSGQKFSISAHIGSSMFPEHAETSGELIRRADAALYYSKENSIERFSIYSKGMASEILNRIRLVNNLREALEKEQLNFVLQGKYNQSRELIGAELLCRWTSSEHGLVSPTAFIPLIEKYGMESQLGLLAIRSAITYIKTLSTYGVAVPISVNISASQILDDNFLAQLHGYISRAGISPNLLELEITESVFIDDDSQATSKLKDIKALGIRISLDDFGTGYSSLSYLGQYNFDLVKIDRSFIIEIEQDLKARKLFDAIMNICTALDLDVVVEGIETESQFSILQSSGVSKFQGFLLGKPSPINDFLDQIKSR